MITPSEMKWSSSWTDPTGQQHTLPVDPVQGTLSAKFIQATGGKGGTMYETFNWDLNKWCTAAAAQGYSRGYVSLSLVAVNSHGMSSQPFSVQVDLSCQQFGFVLPLTPNAALVTFLMVLFVLAVDRSEIFWKEPEHYRIIA